MKRGLFKVTVFLLSLVLLMTGCSDGKSKVKLDPKNPVAIEIWHYYNGPQKIAFDSLITEFNETVGQEQGIVVEAFSQGNVTELIDAVIDSANKKVGAAEIPDVFAAYPNTAYQVDQMGLVADLDKYMTQEELDEYVPGYLDEGRFDKEGTLKIFPIAKSTEIFMLNKTDWEKFASATGASMDDLQTVEGVTETAEKYYDWTDAQTPEPDDGKAFFGRDAVANYMIIGSKQLGVEIFHVEKGEIHLNIDKEVMRKLWDNFYVPYINGYFAANGKFRSEDAKKGNIIALVGSTSGAAYFPNQVMVNDTESYDIEAAVLPAPVFSGGEKVAVQQGAGMVVTKSDEKREYASTVFLKWFTEAQRNVDFSAGSGYLPVKKEANNTELILGAVEKEEKQLIRENLGIALPVAIDVVNTHEMYISKAFDGGTAARDVLEVSMINKANEDLTAIREMMDNGTARKDAVAKYDTDENFEDWFQQFSKDLKAAAQVS